MSEPRTIPEPAAWLLFNINTGTLDTQHGPYVYETNAMAAAHKHGNRWRQLIAAPVFLACDGQVKL